MVLVRLRSFGDRGAGWRRPRRYGAARRQAVDAGIRRHDRVAGIRRRDGMARACDARGRPAWTIPFRPGRSDQSDSHQIKFAISRNEGFTESNLLGEKAA